MTDALLPGMNDQTPSYQIDSRWKIIRANDAFCRIFRSTEMSLLGRDVRDLMRDDWRIDFRTYVARALVGVGDCDVTLPMVAPCGQEGWFKHSLEPLLEDGLLAGYRATIQPHIVTAAAPAKRWWDFRGQPPRLVWNFEVEQVAQVS